MFILSAVYIYFSSTIGIQNVQIKKNKNFFRCLDDLQFKIFFHKQSGTGNGSEIKAKAKSRKIILDPQRWFTIYTIIL